MRSASSFVGGLVVAALIFAAWFFISEKHRPSNQSADDPATRQLKDYSDQYAGELAWQNIHKPGRYQLVHGKVIDAAGQDADIIMRIDTATGQTWECRVELNKGLFWKALTDDPLANPAQK